MVMAQSINYFELLPMELLVLIIDQVTEDGSVEWLSSVSKGFRTICEPYPRFKG